MPPALHQPRLATSETGSRVLTVRSAKMVAAEGDDARAVAGRRAFTIVEAVVAIAITAIAGTALLLALSSSLASTTETVDRAQALGLARQLMDEVLGNRYMEYGCSPYDTVLTAGASELATKTRRLYDDIDDFNNWASQPPVDPWGIPRGMDDGVGGTRPPGFQAPGGSLSDWREEVSVYYVSNSDFSARLSPGRTSDYRAVEVRIYRVDPERGPRELARLRRIVAYVPPLS